MKAKTKRDIEVTIVMDESEAKWLKAIMQNPFYGQTLENERDIDFKNREMFWNILDKEGVGLR